jgi:hypothetical protein
MSVYVFEALGTPFYKLGHGGSSSVRLSACQVGCPFELKEVIKGEGGFLLEQSLQAKYAHRLVRGEWYQFTNEDLSELRDILDNSESDTTGWDIEEVYFSVKTAKIGKKALTKSLVNQLPKIEQMVEDAIVIGWIDPDALGTRHRLNNIKFRTAIIVVGSTGFRVTISNMDPRVSSWRDVKTATPEFWEKCTVAGQIFI